MKRTLFVMLLALGLLLPFTTAVAQGKGNSPQQLINAGWSCFDVPGLGVHCMPPGKKFGDRAIPILYFDTSDPLAAEADFLGTEILIRGDIYNGQPCPQEGASSYHDIGDYFACHRR